MGYLMNTVEPMLEFQSGSGARVVLKNGRWAIDFFCDVGTLSMGYNRSESNQRHVPNLYKFPLRERAAEELCKATGMDKVFFSNSGTEAVEAAIKLARLFRHNDLDQGYRRLVLSEVGGFHGRTAAALAAGNGPEYHNRGFQPRPGGFEHMDMLGDPVGEIHRAAGRPGGLLAVLISPINGNNDVVVYNSELLRDVQHACHEVDALFILDEVQTGSGRTSQFMTYAQEIGLRPDIVTLAKGVAGGVSCGATLARDPVSLAFTKGTHFSTFGGGPAAMAGILAQLDHLSLGHGNRLDRAAQYMRRRLQQPTKKRTPMAKNVRGVGMLIGFDVDVDRKRFSEACLNCGVIIPSFRDGPGPMKITPPLNITDEELEEGFDAMERAFELVS